PRPRGSASRGRACSCRRPRYRRRIPRQARPRRSHRPPSRRDLRFRTRRTEGRGRKEEGSFSFSQALRIATTVQGEAHEALLSPGVLSLGAAETARTTLRTTGDGAVSRQAYATFAAAGIVEAALAMGGLGGPGGPAGTVPADGAGGAEF